VLVNKWISSSLLNLLGIVTPHVEVLEKAPDLLNFPYSLEGIAAGPHFGSQLPVDPTRCAIYDYLPGKLLPKVTNLADLAASLVLEHWFGCTEPNPAIFFRDGDRFFRTCIIGSSSAFGGRAWKFAVQPRSDLWLGKICSLPFIEELCARAVASVREISQEDLRQVCERVPPDWLDKEDRIALSDLFSQLDARRDQLQTAVLDSVRTITMRTA
jgi:hypothetical protein